MNFSPSHLPKIDSVEVVGLRNFDADRVSKYMQEAVDAKYIQITGELAQQIAELWRQLPSGEQNRCHIPPFGLRFYSNGELQLQASICWECHNIFGDIGDGSFSYEFDGQHQISQRLLELCENIFSSLSTTNFTGGA
jgi:hypothetical protein